MLNAWENRRPQRARFNGRLYRVKLRVNRWLIYHLGSGNPEKNPFLLTSKLKNIPLISLRNDEYIDFLSKQHFVGKKWEEYWEKPQLKPIQSEPYATQDTNKSKEPKFRTKGTPNFEIYEDQEANKENLNLFPVKYNKSNKERYSAKFQVIDNKDVCSLDSFERELIASASSLTGSVQNNLFWNEEESVTGNNNLSTRLKPTPIMKEVYLESNNVKNKIDIIGDANIINLTLDNVSFERIYGSTKVKAEKQTYPRQRRQFSNIYLNNAYATVKKRTQGFGLRGWIMNNVRPLTKNSNQNLINSKGNSFTFQQPKVPLIQQASFFSRNGIPSRETGYKKNNDFQSYRFGPVLKARKKKKSIKGNNPKESLKVHYRGTVLGSDLALGSLKGMITKVDGIVTRSDLIETMSKAKAIESLITQIALKNERNQSNVDLSKKATTLKDNKKSLSPWRIFSGLRQLRSNSKKFEITQLNTKSNEIKEKPPTIRVLKSSVAVEEEPKHVEKVSTLKSILHETSAHHSSIDDVYDIFASYEDLPT